MKRSQLFVGGTLGDHPPDPFSFYAHCRDCQRSAQLQTDTYPPETKLKAIRERRR